MTGTCAVVYYAHDVHGIAVFTQQLHVATTPPTALEEHFDVETLPAAWAVTSEGGEPTALWTFDDPGFIGGVPGGSGGFAAADSDYFATNMDAALTTPQLDLSGYTNVRLQFNSDFSVYTGTEVADVDVRIDAGTWDNVWRRTTDAFGHVDITIPEAVGQGNVQFRFHYYNANYDWYWAIDDVIVSSIESDDSDGDGLPDWWEYLHFGNTTNAQAQVDQDGDGMTALDEFRSRSDPTNRASMLQLAHPSSPTPDDALLTWPSEAMTTYNLQRSTNLTLGFSTIVSNIPATPPTNHYLDDTADLTVPTFYRILAK